MRHGGGFRFLAALMMLTFVGLFAFGAFGAGLLIGAAVDGPVAPAWGHGGFIGFLLLILFALILFCMIGSALFGHHHRGWAHHGYWRGGFDAERCGRPMGPMGHMRHGTRPDDWQKSEWREVGQTWFDEFHRRSHGTETPTGSDAPLSSDAPASDQPK